MLLFFLCIGKANAQLIINGTVKDSLQKPISGVSVTLHKKINNIIVAYSITNSQGKYQIKYHTTIQTIDSFYIKANAIGFAAQTKNINSVNESIDFNLKSTAFILPNVTVKNAKPALRYRSDTLSYTVDSFLQKQDRTIGDVLKKMPGIDVDGNGKITYNGKPISNFYIDGDNLLDDKYNIATNSIGADMVKDVQVLENHQPIKMLRDKTYSDKVAINLSMKEKAKLKLMGRAEVGVGFADEILYNGNVNLMAFKPKYKAINSLRANNVGNNISRDIISHNWVDFLKMQENNVPQDLLGINENSNPPIAEERYLFNKTGLLNLNNLVTLKKELQLKANIYYLHNDIVKNFENNTYYYLPNDTIAYLQKQNSKAIYNNWHVKLNLNSNAAKHYLNNTFLVEINNNPIAAANNFNGNLLKQMLKQNNTNFSNDFSLLKTISKKTLQFYSYIAYLNKPEILEIEPGINANGFNSGNGYQLLQQKVNVPGFYTNNSVVLGFTTKKINHTYKIGFTSQAQTLISNIATLQNDNAWKLLPDSFANNLIYNNNTIKFAAKWEYLGNRLAGSFSLPVDIVAINYKERLTTKNIANKYNGIILKPSLQLKYAVGKENSLQIINSFSNGVADIESVYEGKILRNYQQLYFNNFAFSEQQRFGANLIFNYKKTIKILFASIGFSYNKTINNASTNTILNNDMQQTNLIGLANAIENSSAFWGISKYFFKIHSTVALKVNVSSSDWVKMQNNLLLHYLNNTYSANFSITPKINKWLTASYTTNLVFAESKNELNKSTAQKTLQMKHSLEVNYLPNDNLFFTVNADDYYVKQYSNNQVYHNVFGDLSCMYKFNKKKIDIKLSIQNIANIKEFKTINLLGNILTENINIIRSRTYMLRVFFNF